MSEYDDGGFGRVGLPPLSVDEHVGASLSALRLDLGYTRKELACKVAMTREQIAAIEAGEVRPPPQCLIAICQVLNTTAADLFLDYLELAEIYKRSPVPQSMPQPIADNVIYLDQIRR